MNAICTAGAAKDTVLLSCTATGSSDRASSATIAVAVVAAAVAKVVLVLKTL